SLSMLAERDGINQKTVAKWKKRTSVADLPTGPRQARSTVLSVEEEAIIVAFRRYTLLPLDDCLYALQPTIPHLTRSSLHRCLQRHGIGRLPDVEGARGPTDRSNEGTEPSRTQRSGASTTRAMTNSASISPTSSPPTTSAAGSKPSRGSRPTSSFARPGLPAPNASLSTRSSKCRD